MSTSGINSNFSAVSSTDVDANVNQEVNQSAVQYSAIQYTEDEQLLAQSLQTQSLENTAVSNTANLLNSVEPALTSELPVVTAIDNSNSTTQNDLFTALSDAALTAAPGQTSPFGVNASPGGSSNNSGGNNSTESTTTPPGPLQELQASAQQAYTASQGSGVSAANASNTLGTLIG